MVSSGVCPTSEDNRSEASSVTGSNYTASSAKINCGKKKFFRLIKPGKWPEGRNRPMRLFSSLLSPTVLRYDLLTSFLLILLDISEKRMYREKVSSP